MTRFNRKGHYRTNTNGTVSWVQGHTVLRTDWGNGDGISGGNERAIFPATSPRWYSASSAPIHSARPVEPMPLDIWSHRLITAYNARCPVCQQAIFFYRNEHGSAVFFDELGPPWTKHPCTAGELTALFLPSTPQPKPATPQWQVQGWQPLRSAQIFEMELGGYGVHGYSGGELLRFLLAGMSAAQADEIRGTGQAIWHYRMAEHSGRSYQVGVFTPSEQFHVFSLESIDAEQHTSLTLPVEYAKKEPALSSRFDPALAAMFSGNRFLAQPNAICPVCQRGVYVYHHPVAGLLVLDEEGPPWADHDCAVSMAHWMQAGWRRWVFGGFRQSGAEDLCITGHSQGRSVVLKLLGIDKHLTKKLLATKLAYYHYRESGDGSVVLGVYLPGESFLQLQAVWTR